METVGTIVFFVVTSIILCVGWNLFDSIGEEELLDDMQKKHPERYNRKS